MTIIHNLLFDDTWMIEKIHLNIKKILYKVLWSKAIFTNNCRVRWSQSQYLQYAWPVHLLTPCENTLYRKGGKIIFFLLFVQFWEWPFQAYLAFHNLLNTTVLLPIVKFYIRELKFNHLKNVEHPQFAKYCTHEIKVFYSM